MAGQGGTEGPGTGGAEPRRGGAEPGPGGAPGGRARREPRSYGTEEKLALLRAFEASGQGMRAFCAERGLNTASLCKWRRRFAAEGAAGLEPRPNPRNRGKPGRRPYAPEERRKAVEGFAKSGMTAEDFARVWGISTKALSHWRRRYEEGGPKALEPLARRRGGSGGAAKRLPAPVRAEIARVLRRFPLFGLRRVRDWLRRFKAIRVSPGSVRRVRSEESLPPPEPAARRRRRRAAVRRFERSRPRELWQSDITSVVLRRHEQRVYLVVFLDDYSRYVAGWNLASQQRGEMVIEALLGAIGRFGKPLEVLTDQGRQYYSWRGKSDFQKVLAREGIAHVVSRAHHPETLGKCERLWETINAELWDRARPQDLDEARERLEHWFSHYNHFRPHQGIDGMVPADRFFGAEDLVRKAIEERLSENELLLAVGERPRTGVYFVGQVGERQVSVHGERGKVVIRTEEGIEEISAEALGAPSAREEEDHGDEGDGGGGGAADAPLPEEALPAGAGDAGAGEGALGGGDGGGEEAGARDVRDDPRALGGEGDEGGGGGAAEGAAAPGVATVATGAGGDGGGVPQAAAVEEGAPGRRAGGSVGPRAETAGAGEGVAGEGRADRAPEGAARAPGGGSAGEGGEAACAAPEDPEGATGSGSGGCSGRGG